MTPVEYDRWYCSPYISSISHQMQQELPGVEVRAIRQVAEGEGRILTRVGGLMWLVTIAALFAAALAVGATSATTVLERRSEIGLMKALGASHRAVGAFFVAEQLLLALVGGIAGYALGVVLARALGIGIFGIAPDASMDSFSDRSDPGGSGRACRKPRAARTCIARRSRSRVAGRVRTCATRSMFFRILWKLLGASRGRLTLALVALSSGAAVSSALLNVNLDAERKLTQEFRTLGANVVVAPPSAAATRRSRMPASWIVSRRCDAPQIVAAAPYLYVAANSGTQPVILAGTWFDQVAKMNSWWKLDGSWIASRDDHLQCLVGSAAARQLGPRARQSHRIAFRRPHAFHSQSRELLRRAARKIAKFSRTSVSRRILPDYPGRVSLVQLSVSGTPAEIEAVTKRLASCFAGS